MRNALCMAIVTLLILSNDAAVCDALHRIKVWGGVARMSRDGVTCWSDQGSAVVQGAPPVRHQRWQVVIGLSLANSGVRAGSAGAVHYTAHAFGVLLVDNITFDNQTLSQFGCSCVVSHGAAAL